MVSYQAKSFNWPSVLSMLDENPELVNAQAMPAHRWTALHQFAFMGCAEEVEILLQRGADKNLKTKDNETAADLTSCDCASR